MFCGCKMVKWTIQVFVIMAARRESESEFDQDSPHLHTEWLDLDEYFATSTPIF